MRTRSVAALAALAIAAPAIAQPAYEQLPIYDGGFTLLSDGVAGQFFDQQIADNFTLGADTTVTQINFWGGSQNFSTPSLSNVLGFRVSVYSDDDGSPGAAIFTEDVALGDTNATNTGNVNTAFNSPVYKHEFMLGAPLNLDGGEQYWLSVGAALAAPFSDAWFWQRAAPVDFTNGNYSFNNDTWTVFDLSGGGVDEAFQIIPTPAGASLLLVGLGAMRRRR